MEKKLDNIFTYSQIKERHPKLKLTVYYEKFDVLEAFEKRQIQRLLLFLSLLCLLMFQIKLLCQMSKKFLLTG